MPMGEPFAPAAPEGSAARQDALTATKLHIPRARHGLVPRPRLVEWLTEARAGELTVVCAPVGFGKTALLADWARHSGRTVAWLSLDTADNDPVRFGVTSPPRQAACGHERGSGSPTCLARGRRARWKRC